MVPLDLPDVDSEARPLWDVFAVALAALFFAGLVLAWGAIGF